MDEVANPYNPGAGTRPPSLVGRDPLLKTFHIALRRALAGRPGRSMMPTGLRGVGKTVLLNEFAAQARKLGFVVAQFEASEEGRLAMAVSLELRKLLLNSEGLGGKISELTRKALRTLKSFSMHCGSDGMPTFEVGFEAERGAADSGDLARDLTDLLTAIGEACRERGQGVLLRAIALCLKMNVVDFPARGESRRDLAFP